MNKCPNCGLETDTKYCPACGTQVIDTLQSASAVTDKSASVSPDTSSIESACCEELFKYKQLLEEGIITQEDYDNKRQELLGGESVSKAMPQPGPESPSVTPKRASRIPKPALYGIAALAIVLIVVIAIFMNGVGRIQGDWKLYAFRTNGEMSAPISPIEGQIKVTGNKWDMHFTVGNQNIIGGKVSYDQKLATGDDNTCYFYNFSSLNGSVLRGAYFSDSKFLMICNSNKFDTENGLIFKKE